MSTGAGLIHFRVETGFLRESRFCCWLIRLNALALNRTCRQADLLSYLSVTCSCNAQRKEEINKLRTFKTIFQRTAPLWYNLVHTSIIFISQYFS